MRHAAQYFDVKRNHHDPPAFAPVFFPRHAAALAVAATLAAPSFAQAPGAPFALKVHPLTKGVYRVEGGAANTGFVVGGKGVIESTPSAAQSRRASRSSKHRNHT